MRASSRQCEVLPNQKKARNVAVTAVRSLQQLLTALPSVKTASYCSDNLRHASIPPNQKRRQPKLIRPKHPHPRIPNHSYGRLAILPLTGVVPMRATILCLLLTGTLAQQPASTGTVTGHVLCDDTHLPARIASVVLQPILDLTSPALKPEGKDFKPEPATKIVQTLLDGSFIIPDVHPGDYYVIAEKIGYLSPLAQLSREDLNHPTDATAKLMATLLTPVSVAANRTSTTEVHLLKGATIAGTIRFDDGTPDAATGVSLLGRDKSGKWSNFRTKFLAGPFSSTLTDDQGRFRITGLPAGEYLLKTTLELSDVVVDHIFRESGSSSSNTRYSLDIYSGNFMRERDAKPIKLTGAEDSAGNDIEIPLTTLHAISGTVLEGATGRTVNAAHVAIHYTDDDAQLVSVNVSKEDNTFHFLYVPEGEYTLKITEARDVTRTEVPTCPNSPSRCLPPTHTEEKTIRAFGNAEQPLVLHTDITGLTVAVPPRPGGSAAAAAAPPSAP